MGPIASGRLRVGKEIWGASPPLELVGVYGDQERLHGPESCRRSYLPSGYCAEQGSSTFQHSHLREMERSRPRRSAAGARHTGHLPLVCIAPRLRGRQRGGPTAWSRRRADNSHPGRLVRRAPAHKPGQAPGRTDAQRGPSGLPAGQGRRGNQSGINARRAPSPGAHCAQGKGRGAGELHGLEPMQGGQRHPGQMVRGPCYPYGLHQSIKFNIIYKSIKYC